MERLIIVVQHSCRNERVELCTLSSNGSAARQECMEHTPTSRNYGTIHLIADTPACVTPSLAAGRLKDTMMIFSKAGCLFKSDTCRMTDQTATEMEGEHFSKYKYHRCLYLCFSALADSGYCVPCVGNISWHRD